MSDYCGYITRIKGLTPLPNSDRLLIGRCFDDNVIVDNTYNEGELVIYFMAGTQIGEEFAEKNNLIRKVDAEGKNIGGYLEKSRAVKAINIRKSKSDGLALKLECLEGFTDVSSLKEGDRIEVLNGIVIAQKYLPKITAVSGKSNGKEKAVPHIDCPQFAEHIDTAHLDKSLSAFRPGDTVQITVKLDGTSHRTGYFPVTRVAKRNWFQKLLHLKAKTTTDWEIVNGTRRVILNSPDGGYYGSNEFRFAMADKLKGKLYKGEEVFYEIVGYVGKGGHPIRPTVDNKKLNDKEFVKQYGGVTEFSYGCKQENGYDDDPPCCEMYVYRITLTTEDGHVMEYSPDQIKARCEDMGVKYVPECETFRIPEDCTDPGEYVMEKAKQYYDGPDPIGKTHVREGVVLRIVNRRNFAAYKYKNHSYKVLAGIAVDQLVSSGEINELSTDMIEEL